MNEITESKKRGRKEKAGRKQTRGEKRTTAWLMKAKMPGGKRIGHQNQTRKDPHGEERQRM